MSFTLFLDESTPALAAKSPVIKADARKDFELAVDLLAEARLIKAQADADYQEVRQNAQAEGYAQGMAQAQQQIADAIAQLTAQFDAFTDERRDDVAKAAFAAVEAIIGATSSIDTMHGLVDAGLKRVDGEQAVTVEVHPDWMESVSAHLQGREHVAVRENPALASMGLNVISGQGKIVADLQLQMDALAKRWGVEG